MRLAALVAVLTLPTLGGAADPAPPKLYALLAIDTASDLKGSVVLDQQRMDRLLRANVPPDRLVVDTLTGTKLTGPNLVAYYKALKPRPEDTVFFFYAGHGAKDPDKGHALVPQLLKTPPVYRSDVREAMKRTGAGLVVLLTDCCSTKSKLAGKPYFGSTRPVTPKGAGGLHPTLDFLFFRHTGVVDVTAASDGEASWSDFKDGGILTRTLAKCLLRPPAGLDADRDQRVTWKEFFPVLERETQGTYKAWGATMRARGEAIDQPNQRPNAFSLGEPSAGPAKKPDPATPPVTAHAVVCIVNESGEDVKFSYRWAAADPWKAAAILPKKRGEYSAAQTGSELPRFEIQFEGSKSVAELEADAWSGAGPPPPGAAGREYPIVLRK